MFKGILNRIARYMTSDASQPNHIAEGLNTGQITNEDAKYAEMRAAYLPTNLDPPF